MKTNVELELAEGVAWLVFSAAEPVKPASVDYELLDLLELHLKKLSAAAAADVEAVRVLVLASASPKYFVVGANLEALKSVDQHSIAAWIERGHEVYNRLADLPFPVIAKVTGYALGGGLELAMACDWILAADSARFGQPEAGLGFVAGWGGCLRLPAIIGSAAARELFSTGRIIEAAEAYRLGLVNFAGSPADLERRLAETIEQIKKNSATAVSQMKRIMNAEQNRMREFSRYAETASSIACLAAGDTARRLEDFFAKRAGK